MDGTLDIPLIMLTDRSIGDMICAMTALQILAADYEQVVISGNIPQLYSAMAPPNANFHTGWLPYRSKATVFNVSVGGAMNPRYGHPIKQVLDHIGIEAPCAIPQPFWRERTAAVTRNPRMVNGVLPLGEDYYDVRPIVYPEYDFLIHLNTDDDERCWP